MADTNSNIGAISEISKDLVNNSSAINEIIQKLRALFDCRQSELGNSQSPDDTVLHNIMVMLEFSSRCRTCDLKGQSLLAYVSKNESALLNLSVAELQTCSELCVKERNGTVEIARKLLYFAVQKCMREQIPHWSTIGYLYSKIIKLSSSRQEVIQ